MVLILNEKNRCLNYIYPNTLQKARLIISCILLDDVKGKMISASNLAVI